MTHIITIIAPSRSGKDTLAKMLPCTNIKFSRPMKAALEQAGGLPEGALESDEYRNMPLPTWNHNPGVTRTAMASLEGYSELPSEAFGSLEFLNIRVLEQDGGTYLDALIATYHFFHRFAPMLPKRGTIRQVKSLAQEGVPMVFTDVRMVEEVEIILATGLPLVTVELSRQGSSSISTDGKAQEILELLKKSSIAFCPYDNSGSLDELRSFAWYLHALVATHTKPQDSKPVWIEGRNKVKITRH